MRVFRRPNRIFTSNTYILSKDNKEGIYVVDPGDSQPIFEWLKLNKTNLTGIFLTHAHFDHIYGLNDLLSEYPTCKLYISTLMIDGLYSEKLNTSKYHEKPYVLNRDFSANISFLEESTRVMLWDENIVTVLFTPGHTIDSITLNINDYLFTGDALIPGVKIFKRNKKTGNESSQFSVEKIYSTNPTNSILLPGHGKDYLLGESKSVENFCKLDFGTDFKEIHKVKL